MTEGEACSLLGVQPGADIAAVDRAFRRAAKDAHPTSPKGSRDSWERLVEARAVLKSGGDPAPGHELVPLSVAVEAIRKHGEALDRREVRERQSVETDAIVGSIVRRQTSPLSERKQKAWLAAVVAGGLGLLVVLLRAVAITEWTPASNGLMIGFISACGVGAAVAGVAGWTYRTRVERTEHDISDAVTHLAGRGRFLQMLAEIERESCYRAPWSYDELEEATEEWSFAVGSRYSDSLARLALRIHPRDFTQLIISKGLEVGGLTEETRPRAEGIHVLYRPGTADPN